MSVTGVRWWTTGAALGVLGVLVVLPTLRVDAAPTPPAASLSVTAGSTGELGVARPGVLLRSGSLLPGSAPVSGTARIVNQTARPLRVRVRVRPLTHELDGVVVADVRAGRQQLVRQALDSRAAWSRNAFVLQPLERQTLTVTVRPARAAADRFAGRETEARLDLRSEVAPA